MMLDIFSDQLTIAYGREGLPYAASKFSFTRDI